MVNYNIWKIEVKTGVEKHGIKHKHRDYLEVAIKKKAKFVTYSVGCNCKVNYIVKKYNI